MPWKETCCMCERERFVGSVRAGHSTISELCRQFGISRKTAYKWLNRFDAEGPTGLQDRSRARHTQADRVPDSVRRAIIRMRRRYPTWGAKKLAEVLARTHPRLILPSRTTITSIITEAGLVKPQRRRRRLKGGTGGLGGHDHPNGVWATDFKGQHRLGDGSYCHPLTVTDSCSRYVLCCRGFDRICGESVRKAFTRLFRTHGVPKRIRSDNGSPFASCGTGRLTQLSVFWIDQGIELQRTAPGCPQQNGRHERMHRTLKAETTQPIAATVRTQQSRYDRWRRVFNEERPHEALDMACPADLYEASSRAYNERPGAPEYESGCEVRRVQKNGSIKLHGDRIFVSECLRRRDVGLFEAADGMWHVYYRHHSLGLLDTTEKVPRIRAVWSRDQGT